MIDRHDQEPGMRHPAFDIVTILGQGGLSRPDPETLLPFTRNVCHMRVYIPGDRLDMPTQRTATRFSLDADAGAGLPGLPLYMRETDAIKVHGPDGYFAAKFRLALLFADSYRADARLIDGAQSLLIRHDKLLALRDLNSPKPLSSEDLHAQREAMLTLAIRARSYCVRQADVNSLHLASLATPGGRPMLVGSLSADHYEKHANALRELATSEFRPGWRFVLLDEAPGHAAIATELWKIAPCYMKVPGQGWWGRMKSKFESPALSLAGITQR
jgi:hypothetical protein